MQKIPLPSVILFDWDDTLISTWPYLWRLYQETFELFGYNLLDFMNEATCKDYAVRNGRRTFTDALGEDVGQKARDYFLSTYAENFSKHLKAMDGSRAVLDTLKKKDIPMGIVSNKESTFLKREIAQLEWDGFFMTVVGRDVVGPKPSPEPVFHALKDMGQTASHHVWFIGDTLVDHETARASGCFSVGFGPIATPGEDGSPQVQHDMGVTNWNQFQAILEEIHLK